MKQNEEILINHEGVMCWVTALMAEAKPIIDHYHLVKINAHSAFPVFSDEAGRFWLVISGVGKTLSAAATASIYHAAGEREGMAWLNIGIAGHRERDLGEIRWVNKIQDAASGNKWYPPRIFQTGVRKGSALITVDRPGDYPEGDTLVDMETSGFYQIASRFSTRELVQSVKIVSDNAENSWRDLKKGQVENWVRDQMEGIVVGSEELMSLSVDEAKRCAQPIGYGEMLLAWRFTATEKHFLRKILRRRQVIIPDYGTPVTFCQRREAKSGAEALRILREELAQSGDELFVSN